MNIQKLFLVVLAAATVSSCMAPTGTTVAPGNTTTKYVSLSAPANHSLTGGPLSVSVSTTTYGGSNAPDHVMVVWVEDNAGTFLRTLGVWGKGELLTNYLKIWKVSQGSTTVDGITGATLVSHETKSVTWDLKDHSGASVPAGTYRLKAEMNESSATSKTDEVSLTLTSP